MDGLTAFNQLPGTNQSDYWNVTAPDTIRYIPPDSVSGTSQLNHTQTPDKQTETPIDNMTTSDGLEIRNYTPLYWDWKFQNVTDGNLITKMQQPLYSIDQYFGDPGHWYVYYHEYARWETGYWEETDNGRVWHHVSWEEGYLYSWRYLTDFYLSEWEIRKTWTVPSGVQEHRLDVETVQQVAK
ncbi:hypothetical protein CVV65_05665 [Kyrpidia spormannii]|uniref:Uncharacterized protein n=1 Tax=Kyrpidia spormannii TaxID=2055160 RepID=A0A2K8N5Z1_9BACL|nr:hypothetical protein [Kyrpidia spormannii]ATY84505.1 hypothetical protein CVV65_05665 [Kyrpidia spormannii]